MMIPVCVILPDPRTDPFSRTTKNKKKKSSEKASSQPEEGSEKYWNEQLAELGSKTAKAAKLF
jgi:hypothetical protein